MSLIFIGFAVVVPFQRNLRVKSKQAVEVFSLICFGLSLFFLTFLPSLSLGAPLGFSIVSPLLGVMVIHLFLVYPKKKGTPWVRNGFLTFFYAVGFTTVALKLHDWMPYRFPFIHELDIPFLGVSFLIALSCLANTLMTSKDFWARRRARLMSLVFLASFVGILSVFMAFVWEVPRLSFERVLAISLFFPTAFAVIFLKSDVFDLERIFRRGLHQLLLLIMAATFALLVGIGWSQWRIAPEDDWMLWVAISIVVIIVARPAGYWFESGIHRLIQTRVPYPRVNEIFEESRSLEDFLISLGRHFETFLNMKNITFTFFQDPTLPWSEANQQSWRVSNGIISRTDSTVERMYKAALTRGETVIGEVSFDGGDAIAFDPKTSGDWTEVVRSVARCLELLCLEEFISIQQGFLAVGRMQSLLAHEMKNPLSIIKVCSGLLSSHLDGSEEGEELVRTIQGEVRRVASAVQNIFEHSGRVEKRQRLNLSQLLKELHDSALSRFPGRFFDVRWNSEELSPQAREKLLYIWVDREGLKQALNNLIINAFEAGSPLVEIDISLHDKSLAITIRDKGTGLPENVELFKPFVTTKPNGTGLGLMHVKAFMDRNQGQIRIKSERGVGTAFTLEFPRDFILMKEKMRDHEAEERFV